MAFNISCTKSVWAARLETTSKRCELQLFLAIIRQAVRRLKAIQLGRLNVHFQQDWPKKNYSSFNFLPENLEKFRSTELYGAPLKGSTIFLNRSSTCRMSMESYRLADLKYVILSITESKILKNYRARSSFFGRSLTLSRPGRTLCPLT